MNNKNCCKKMFEIKEQAVLGQEIKPLSAKAVDKTGKFFDWNIETNYKAGKWTVIAFYPADFTFVCPTEIRAISALKGKFEKAKAEIVVASVDSQFVHLNWRNSSLGKVDVTMLADTNHKISEYFGIYSEENGLAWRGTFIISPKGVLYVNYSTFAEVGRSAEEMLRLLEAAKRSDAGELVPCEWKPGDKTLKKP